MYHRDEQVLYAKIQVLLDQYRVVNRRPDQGVDRVTVDGLELAENGFQSVGAVLGVHQKPVKS
jgi:hypothetical protein